MVNLTCTERNLNVSITKGEKITYDKAKKIIIKGRRIIEQNKVISAVIELEDNSSINKSALDLFNRVLCNNNDFPVTIIGLNY